MLAHLSIAIALLSLLLSKINAALICGASGTLGFAEQGYRPYVTNLEGCLDACLGRSECLSYQFADDGFGLGGYCSISAHTVANSNFQIGASGVGIAYDLGCDVPTTGPRPPQAAPVCGVCSGGGCQKKMIRKRGSGSYADMMSVPTATTPAECLAACRANSDGNLGCDAIYFSVDNTCTTYCSLLLGTYGNCEDRPDPLSSEAYYDINCPPDQLSYNCGGLANTCLTTSTSSSSTSTSIFSSTTSSASTTKTSTFYSKTLSNFTVSTKHPTYASSKPLYSSPISYTRTGQPVDYSTSTVYGTSLITITTCPSSVYDCPASAQRTSVITTTIVLGTTVCPLAALATSEPSTGDSYVPIGNSSPTSKVQTLPILYPVAAQTSEAPTSRYYYYGPLASALSFHPPNSSPLSTGSIAGNRTSISPVQYTGAASETVAFQVEVFYAVILVGVVLL